MKHRDSGVWPIVVGLLAAALWFPATIASGQGQATDGLGYREPDPAAERLRIEREAPVVRAQARSSQLRHAGRFAEALAEAGRATELARQCDYLLFYSTRQMEGRILVDLGRYADALPCLLTGIHTGAIDGVKTDIALCRLKLGDLKAARSYDVQPRLLRWFGLSDAAALPGTSTSAQLEAALWLDRGCGNDGHFLNSRWAIRAARISPTNVAANWLAAERLGCLGQRSTERKYLMRAAAGPRCGLQADAKERLGWRTPEECKDRYRQGTMPPPPGEGIEPVPDP